METVITDSARIVRSFFEDGELFELFWGLDVPEESAIRESELIFNFEKLRRQNGNN